MNVTTQELIGAKLKARQLSAMLRLSSDALVMVTKERDALNGKLQASEAELAAMKQQAPAAYASQCTRTKKFGYIWHEKDDVQGWVNLQHQSRDDCTYTRPIELYLSPGAQPVPAGMQLVPIEPTEAMLTAATRASLQHLIDCVKDPAKSAELGGDKTMKMTYAARYKAMLEAAKS